MEDKSPTELLLLQSAEVTGRTSFCPDDQQITEYYEGMLPGAERERVERHVADCRFCAARIGMLARLDEGVAQNRVPEDALAAAKLMGRSSAHIHRRFTSWAAAAIAALVLGLYFQPFSGSRTDPGHAAVEPVGQPGELRETRSLDPTALGPRILSPLEGGLTGPGRLISWTPVTGSLYYQVRIVSAEGDLLWQERVERTDWRLPANLELAPGAEYYLRIDAFVTDAKSLQSEYLLLLFGDSG
jgi:hypothetical protein